MTPSVPMFVVPGGPELLVVLLILVLLFGASKVPKLARSTGQALGEFHKGREQVEQELEQMRETDEPQSDESTAERSRGSNATGTRRSRPS